MFWKVSEIEALPKFAHWAIALDDLPAADEDGQVLAWAWFDPPDGWRVAGDGDDDRRCSAMRCVAHNGPRPVVAVLTRYRWVRSFSQRRPALYGYCAEHAESYGIRVNAGRVLWARSFRLGESEPS